MFVHNHPPCTTIECDNFAYKGVAVSTFSGAIAGTWQMDHDGWQGALVLNPPDAGHDQVNASCTFHYYRFTGTWSGGVGSNLAVIGRIGGRDGRRRTGETCPASDHKFTFTIAFPGAAPQPFEGYIFTHELSKMAGYTWWQGMPFAWFASK